MTRLAAVCLATLLFAAIATAADKPAEPAGPPGRAILTLDGSNWRWHMTWTRPIARAQGKPDSAVVLKVTMPYRDRPDGGELDSPPPPANWAAPDFDDIAWTRWRGPIGPNLDWQFQTGLLCLRGRFSVADPAAVASLRLSLTYRGGAVVYLNGQEVARGDMPAGEIDALAPASPYPDEVWFDSKGALMPMEYHAQQRIKAGEADLADRLAKRDRSIAVDLPREKLVKGINVLAVAVHRADYHPACADWFGRDSRAGVWVPCALSRLRLTADGAGIQPNVQRPAGAQLWNADIHDRLAADDYGDPTRPLSPITLLGPRNGTFSGMVVLSSDRAIAGVKATMSELSGPGSIPASAAQVRYCLDADINNGANRPAFVYEMISPVPPAEAAVRKPAPGTRTPPDAVTPGALVPVLVSVAVPPDAQAGQYEGRLTVSADGFAPQSVPVRLRVIDLALPKPTELRPYIGLYQSPTSLALQYNVQEWSEKHWELMAQSMALLGQVGADIVNIPVVDQTQFGNDDGMITWVLKKDGSFDHDFKVFDRYMDLVGERLGKPEFVALHVWHASGWDTRGVDEKNTVTVRDEATGKIEHRQVPPFGTPESKAFWTPVLHAIRDRLAKRGLEKSMCLGVLSDGTAPPAVFTMFNEILPNVGWARGCHTPTRATAPVPLKGGSAIVLWEYVYGVGIDNPARKLADIWKFKGPGAAFFRADFDWFPAMVFHTAPERGLFAGSRGAGRFGLDFWNVIDNKRTRENIYNRWPHSSCAQREPTVFRMAYPGPSGPLPSLRFECLRQGVQEADAMMTVAQAAVERTDKPDLAKRCRDVWFERVNVCRQINGLGAGVPQHYTDWQARAARLYDAAAEAAKK